MSHGAELALLLLESVLEGQDAGSLLPVDLHVVHEVDHVVILTTEPCLDKSVVEDQVDSGLGSRVCALISFLSAGVGALQLDVALASRNVLALHLPHHTVDELDRVGVGKQLIAGENILEDLHGGEKGGPKYVTRRKLQSLA